MGKEYDQIVRAEITDRTGRIDEFKLKARIRSGHYQGRNVSVFFLGNPQEISKEVVLRVTDDNFVPRIKRDAGINGSIAYFINSSPDQGFEYSDSAGVVLHTPWPQEVIGTGMPNSLNDLNMFHSPGPLFAAHCSALVNGSMATYTVSPRGRSTYMARGNRDLKSLRSILKDSYRRISERGVIFPRALVYDERIDFNKRILPALEETDLTRISLQGSYKPVRSL